MSTTYRDKTIGELVAEQPARSRVFEQFGIDYCCGGKKPLADACEAKGIPIEGIELRLQACDRLSPAPEVDWTKATLTELCDNIEQTHHAYLRDVLPRLSYLTERVANAHGANDPRLVSLRDIFAEFRADIEQHTTKEEVILFPLCRKMDGADKLPVFHCGSIANPIRVMVAEHDDAGHGLEEMSALTDGFTAPPTACNTFRALMQALQELEQETHVHVHKENSILFPKAEATEAALAAKA